MRLFGVTFRKVLAVVGMESGSGSTRDLKELLLGQILGFLCVGLSLLDELKHRLCQILSCLKFK